MNVDSVRWLDYTIINIERGWTTGKLAADHYHCSVDEDSEFARSWCTLGALRHAYKQITGRGFTLMPREDQKVWKEVLCAVRVYIGSESIEHWNDHVVHSKAQVLLMLKLVRKDLIERRIAQQPLVERRPSTTIWDRFWDRLDKPPATAVAIPPTTIATAHDRELDA